MGEDHLHKYLSPVGAWALAFGCSVGWGCFVMPGTTFLPLAGPVGTALGMLIGGFVMLIIGINYHYMIGLYPDSGGTFTYTKKESGYDHGILSTWFLLLVYVAIIWANATAIPLIFRNLLGPVFEWGFHYQIAGFDVYTGEILISLIAIALAAVICIIGGRFSAVIQTVFAIILIGGITIGAVAVFIGCGFSFSAIAPGFVPLKSKPLQILQIVVLAPWAFVGFESISHSAEEFNFSEKKSLLIMFIAIITGVMAYSFMALMAVARLPEGCANWMQYLENLGSYHGYESLPTFNTANHFMGNAGMILLGLTTTAGIMTGLIGNTIAVTRLIYSMSRDNLIPKKLSRLSKNGVPVNAILFIVIISLPIPFLGRTAIGWIVDVNTIGAAIAYTYTSAVAFKAARKSGNVGIMITGVVGAVISLFFTAYFLIPNIWSASAMAPESYVILIVWSVCGFLFFRYAFLRDRENRFGRTPLVWIALLFMILFVSMLWFRERSLIISQEVIGELSDYNSHELSEHGVKLDTSETRADRAFMERQLKVVDDAMMRNSLIQMTAIVIALFVMFNIYNKMQKRTNEMEVEKARAEQSNRAKTLFLSNMSHDLRTPMNAIIGYTRIAREVENLPKEELEYLDKIDHSSQHLLSIINDILDLSRIENGKMDLTPERTDLTRIFREVEEIFANQMEGKGIKYTVDTGDVKDNFVICDANRLSRVLMNLISNAFKYTQEGGTVSVTLRQTGTSEKRGEYEITVKDNGMGMSPEFAMNVFDAYSRENTASNIQGTGLGMAITKSLVDLMGGKIRLNTRQGEGTEILLDFGFDLAPVLTKEEMDESRREREAIDYSKHKLLLVEDQPVNREIAKKILTKFGFRLDVAEDGSKALSMVSASAPGEYTAVLMDIQMPVMNGYEATKAIRELDDPDISAIPIIAMSANAFEEDVKTSLEAGMNAHVAKPIEIPKLMETLDKIILGQ